MQIPTRTFWLAALMILGAAPVGAQTPTEPVPAPALSGAAPATRPDRAIERIRIEDAGSRIDELRVGGETQNITVQPAANVPAYQIKPPDASRRGNGSAADTGAGSQFWNILKF